MAKMKLRWIKRRKKGDAEVPYETPVWLGNLSNGEFYRPQTDKERKVRDLILQRCDENARRHGMDRREFIASSMGMATTLSVLNLAAGCGNKAGMMDAGVLDRMMSGAGSTAYDAGLGGVGAAAGGTGGPGMTGAAAGSGGVGAGGAVSG
jgi:hypothetical protein